MVQELNVCIELSKKNMVGQAIELKWQKTKHPTYIQVNLDMTDDMLGPSPMHFKYSSYVYDGFCICRTNFPGPIESVISKFTCIV